MRLTSLDGCFVELAVAGYQFAGLASRPGEFDWDANWLMVRGDVRDGSTAWTFFDPCLTTAEADGLASWLRGLGDFAVTGGASDFGDRRLEFTEPNLAFAVREASKGVVTLDVRFDLESRPAGSGGGRRHVVRLRIPVPDIAAAAVSWERDVARFPAR